MPLLSRGLWSSFLQLQHQTATPCHRPIQKPMSLQREGEMTPQRNVLVMST
jgi:hypothetical protein